MSGFRPFSSSEHTGHRFGFNGMEKDDEVNNASGTSYTTFYRHYDSRLGRWKSMDPLAQSFPWQSPYAGLDNSPMIYNDPKGDSVRAIFDKSGNTMYMWDFDHYQEGLPTAYLGPEMYDPNGVYDDDGNLVMNQVLVIKDVFTGGESDPSGITYGNNELQLPIPNGEFEILDYASTKPSHSGWYRIDPLDSKPRNDQYDNPDYRNAQGELRENFRLHIGAESWGCITCNGYSDNAVKGFKMMSTVLQKTTTSEVRDRLGLLNSLGLRDTKVKKFGQVKVVP